MAPPEIPLHSHEFLFADKELNNEHLASVSLSFPLCLRSPTGTAETNLPTGRSNLSTIFIRDNRFLVQSPNSEASGFLGNYHSKTRGISSASSKVRCEFFFFFRFYYSRILESYLFLGKRGIIFRGKQRIAALRFLERVS